MVPPIYKTFSINLYGNDFIPQLVFSIFYFLDYIHTMKTREIKITRTTLTKIQFKVYAGFCSVLLAEKLEVYW